MEALGAEEQILFQNMCGMKITHNSLQQYSEIPNVVNILLIGKTGSGKSSTGNTLLGREAFKASASMKSVTKTVQKETNKEGTIKLTILDTPGLFDTGESKMSNEDILLEITKTAITCPEGIHTILIVCKGGDRFTAEDEKTMNDVEEHFGKEIFDHCILIFSNGYSLVEDIPLSENLKNVDKGLKELLNKVSSRAMGIENKSRSKIVESLQRTRLLCAIADIIHSNGGKLYTNDFFEIALKRVQEKEERLKNLKIMEQRANEELDYFINILEEAQLQEILQTNKLDRHTLRQIVVRVRRDDDLNFVKDDDVITFLGKNLPSKAQLIALKIERIHEEKELSKEIERRKQEQRKADQERRRKSEMSEEKSHVENIIKSTLLAFVKSGSKSEILELKSKILPTGLWSSIKDRLSNLKYVDETFIKEYSRQQTELNSSQIHQRLTEILDEEKRLRVSEKSDKKKQQALSDLKTNINVFLDTHMSALSIEDLIDIKENAERQTKIVSKLNRTFGMSEHYGELNVPSHVDKFVRSNADKLLHLREVERKRQIEIDRDRDIRQLLQSLSEHVDTLIKDNDVVTLQEIQKDGTSSDHLSERFTTTQYPHLNEQEMQQLIADVLGQYERIIKQTVSIEEKRRKESLQRQQRQKWLAQKQRLKDEVNDVVEEQVESFLRGKDFEYLKGIKPLLDKKQVPREIRSFVICNLNEDVDDHDVDDMILEAVETNRSIIEEIAREKAGWFARTFCFPGSAKVMCKARGWVDISAIQVGDKVLAVERNGSVDFKDVYFLAHNEEGCLSMYLSITTTSMKVITMSPEHCLPIGSITNLKAACEIKVGDNIFTLEDKILTLENVSSVRVTHMRGAYCPYTLSGTIFVNGIVASCFTDTVPPKWTQKLLAPMRYGYRCLPFSVWTAIAKSLAVTLQTVQHWECYPKLSLLLKNIKHKTTALQETE